MDFLKLHKDRIVALAPRSKALETPIKIKKETYDTHRYRYTDNGYERYETQATRKIIENNY